MTYNTGNPLGSSDPRDLFDNAENFDVAINSSADTFEDRLGATRHTLAGYENLATGVPAVEASVLARAAADAAAGQADMAAASAAQAEAARDAALAMAGFAETVSAGLAETTDGEFFAVPSDDDDASLVLYKNDSGSAIEIVVLPSSAWISNRVIDALVADPSAVPLVVDAAGNVPVWLENGALAVSAVSDQMLDLVGDGVGLSQADVEPSFVPLVVDAAGNVAIWLESGMLCAKALGDSLVETIAEQVGDGYQPVGDYGPAVSSSPLPVATDGRSLFRLRAGVAIGEQIKVLITGDSWTERPAIPAALKTSLGSAFGATSYGWVSTNAAFPYSGTSISHSGWTAYDASGGSAPVGGCGVDGQAIEATGTSATFSISDLPFDSLTIYYRDGDGAFRYRVDGGSWVTVTGGSTGNRDAVVISASSGDHDVDIDLTGNTGVVRIYGMYADTASADAVMVKAGNSSLDAMQASLFADEIEDYAADINPHLVIVCLGTNDYRRGIPLETYIQGLYDIADAYRAGSPNCGLIFMAPADSDATAVIPLTEYRDAAYRFCIENGYEFYNLHDEFSDYATMNAIGLWADPLHLNNAGGRFVSNQIFKHFF